MHENDRIKSAFITTQLEQSINTFRMGYTVLAQIITILVVANVTIVGYAITNQIAGVMIIGAAFPLLILFIADLSGHLLVPVIFTTFCIEKKYGEEGIEGLMTSGLSVNNGDAILNELSHIYSLQQKQDRVTALRKVKFSMLGNMKKFVYAALLIFSLLEAVTPIILVEFYDWRLL